MKTITLIAGISLITDALCNDMSTPHTLQMATYNTMQIPLNPLVTQTAPKIIHEIIDSDIDVICLQEVFAASLSLQFQKAVSSKYPYSYSEANTLELNNTPHAACSSDQINKVTSNCIRTNCASSFQTSPVEFIACAATKCQDDLFPLIDTECHYCIIAQAANKKSLTDTITTCSTESTINYAMTGGTVILSKYPILKNNTYTFPSNMMHRNILFTEIDISTLTNPPTGITDTMIFGCVHLVSTDGEISYFPTTQIEVDNQIKSYEQLNAWQAEYIFNTISLNSGYNVLGVVVGGDLNVGEALFPDNLQIWEDHGFVNVQDFFENAINEIEPCTFCGDANGKDMQNALAIQNVMTNPKLWRQPNADIDHILIYNDHLEHIWPIFYNRTFTDNFNFVLPTGNIKLPLSDHWAVMVEVELIR
eukprot:770924_1